MDENVLVKNLLPCVKQAGSKIIDIYDSKPNAEKKNDGSPVTIADKAAETIIIKKLMILKLKKMLKLVVMLDYGLYLLMLTLFHGLLKQ